MPTNRLYRAMPAPVRAQVYSATILICSLCITVPATAQTGISGVINQYARVKYISPAGDRVQVTPNVFTAGDKVLAIQMKGATINGSNTALYGSVTALNNAGGYEYSTVQSVRQDTVILVKPFCLDFNPNDSVQLIRVPVYNGNAAVTGTLTCTPWGPGGIGGVLAFDVTDTLVLQADINVSHKGFRGAQRIVIGFKCCDSSHYYYHVANEGMKGEGIAHYITNQWYGCGNLANGGGGASGGNSGAGGGGGYGSGGTGGHQFTHCYGWGCPYLQGMGGSALVYQQNRIFMGGGGGGPQADNGFPVYPGGNGGGIVIIRAGAIRGDGHNIFAEGEDIIPQTSDEAAPGGGGGGSIHLHCDHYTTPLHLSARGGAGGDNYNGLYILQAHGPGGGGGGGVIRVSPAALPAHVTTDISGGAAGMVLNPLSPFYNTSYGAQPGDTGAVLFRLTDESQPSLELLKDTIVCSDTIQVTLDIGPGYTWVRWSDNRTTPSIKVNGPGTWYVQALAGCTLYYDTARIAVDPGMTLGADTAICPGSMLTLTPQPADTFVAWQWQDGSFLPQLEVRQSGIYHVLVQSVNGCIWTDTIRITIDSMPELKDTAVCNSALGFRISLPEGYLSYQWSNGSATPAIQVMEGGIYTVTATTRYGCMFSDTVSVTVFPDPLPQLGADTVICFARGDTLSLYPGDFTRYMWQDNSIQAYYTVRNPGTYRVHVTDMRHCTATAAIDVLEDDRCNIIFLPNVFTPNGDGVNDLFRILGSTGNMQGVSFGIFNRWGQQVFFTDDKNRGWDGTCKSGDAPIGTYAYLLQYNINGKPYLLKGNVHLVR